MREGARVPAAFAFGLGSRAVDPEPHLWGRVAVGEQRALRPRAQRVGLEGLTQHVARAPGAEAERAVADVVLVDRTVTIVVSGVAGHLLLGDRSAAGLAPGLAVVVGVDPARVAPHQHARVGDAVGGRVGDLLAAPVARDRWRQVGRGCIRLGHVGERHVGLRSVRLGVQRWPLREVGRRAVGLWSVEQRAVGKRAVGKRAVGL